MEQDADRNIFGMGNKVYKIKVYTVKMQRQPERQFRGAPSNVADGGIMQNIFAAGDGKCINGDAHGEVMIL